MFTIRLVIHQATLWMEGEVSKSMWFNLKYLIHFQKNSKLEWINIYIVSWFNCVKINLNLKFNYLMKSSMFTWAIVIFRVINNKYASIIIIIHKTFWCGEELPEVSIMNTIVYSNSPVMWYGTNKVLFFYNNCSKIWESEKNECQHYFYICIYKYIHIYTLIKIPLNKRSTCWIILNLVEDIILFSILRFRLLNSNQLRYIYIYIY